LRDQRTASPEFRRLTEELVTLLAAPEGVAGDRRYGLAE
jgi:uracil phosphoribosyltransferase